MTYTPRPRLFAAVLVATVLAPAALLLMMPMTGGSVAEAQVGRSVVNTPHNLSAMGPGPVRATTEEQVCIFCHTPHNASAHQPLWNRNVLPQAYRPYSSTSLDAQPGQPTGTSKLCLSCHDGTVALGNVVSRNQPINMAGGMTTIPPGRSRLGTDLTDDHPISFRYDAALVAKDPKLRDPQALPAAVKLDSSGELQCTTCHDAHDNSKGAFLVMDNSASQLCASCHKPGQTTIAGHAQCASCHQQHTAPSGPWLLKGEKVADTCAACHSGGTGTNQGPDVMADARKASTHDTAPPVNLPNHAPIEATCSDCHGPHTMKEGAAVAPNIPLSFGTVKGVNLSGGEVAAAQYEYQVCFRCHGDNQNRTPAVARVITQVNTRLEFAPTAVSYHPVTAAGKNDDVPSLRAGLTSNSMIYCNDCHGSDTSVKGGGTGADGVHGSNVSPVLIARYDTRDNTAESAAAYALCYRCHDRSSILGDQSFTGHRKHIVDQRTPCSACHDSHGIASTQGNATNNAHLMNFDTTIVRPFAGKIEYRRTGPRTGTCTLNCHGKDHNAQAYPGN